MLLGSLLLRLNIEFNPVLWASIQIISSFLSFSIAANVFVRFLGTDNRTALLLGSAFGVIGLAEIAGIIELHRQSSAVAPQHASSLISWMISQTLLAVILLLAFPVDKWLPWPRQRRKTVFAVLSIVVAAGYLVTVTFLALLPRLTFVATRVLPQPGELLPAGIFLASAFFLHRNAYRNRCAFDAMLVWVAAIGALCHLIASQSVKTLDAPAMAAQLLHTISYAMLLGATLVDNVRLFGEVRDRAISDSLTGLANYRQFLDVLHGELERFGRTRRPFCVLLLDLDGLKKINDKHGHTVGSRAICRVAEILRLHCRAIDTAARYGGDEFALILPETEAADGQEVAARIRKNLASDGEAPALNISIGVASCPRDGASVQHLLDAADRELYGVKTLSKKSRSWRQLPLGL